MIVNGTVEMYCAVTFVFRREIDDSGTAWNNSGCRTVEYENGFVMCLCDHLTHFAIILSPGVKVRERERETDAYAMHNNNYRAKLVLLVLLIHRCLQIM